MPGVRLRSSEEDANKTITTTTERVAATLPGISTDGSGDTITVRGVAIVVVGTGATALVLRIRQGTGIAGTIISESSSVSATAANIVIVTLAADDNPGDVADQQYVLTVQQTGATADGTINYSHILGVVD